MKPNGKVPFIDYKITERHFLNPIVFEIQFYSLVLILMA